jgi:LmbE family N-acetylglucosaminyl deacetylase
LTEDEGPRTKDEVENSLTILAIFAHPDDEIGVGSTLACYSDKGVRTVLLCATRGEVATIFCDDCATRENLAEVRTAELECACSHIGIGELRWLDWPDGGVKNLPRPESIGQIVRQIRDIRPDVILTHPEHGLYPHPDHLAIWEMVRAAFSAAADESVYPEAGPAWAAARLFTRALPQSIFAAAPGLSEFRVELNGELLPFYATPDNEIDVIMRVEPWVERRMAAWACHRSQHNPKGFSATMPDGVRQEMAANEHYLLAAARVPLPDGVTDDLLADLTPAAPEPTARSAGEAAALRAELAAHRALVEVCETYLRTSQEPKFRDVCNDLVDGEQMVIHVLARALRMTGEPAGAIEADAGLRARGRRQTRLAERLVFLNSTVEQALVRCRARAAEYRSGVWAELVVSAEAQVGVVAALTGE